ncbi:hypothetical protein PHYPSEUDO_011054 [Phytophthora pseudosyringae]|uniref:Uncharacterized protein n=1 Tax=Phytophthora pseudosyringae TaxID=221518 RepID=A0A8T1V8X1_9STRA|nr:hypothetical protein PHYPSEUDO_011054 [Phytophthora pseudosyringae]
MRWYCVHPSLPTQAELRIRAAPDSSAAERARISQGRAIAACSPVFQVPDVDADPLSWLQVAYQDAASGETEGGFVMVAMPDGTALVTPWESTDFYGCCEVMNSTALLFEGPHETAQSFGPVHHVNFLYCVLEEREKRVRVFHPELESAWFEKKDLHIVCTRLRHGECSTPHTFYELDEMLPEEAQVAIREFPSKEAQTVGLLSRGETLEVTVRGGNWLQIVGGRFDKSWIMWRTDALELLQEAPDVCSSTCGRIEKHLRGTGGGESLADQGSCGDNAPSPDEAHDESPIETVGEVITAPEEGGDQDAAAAAVGQSLTANELAFPITDEENAAHTEPGEAQSAQTALDRSHNDFSDSNPALATSTATTDGDDAYVVVGNVEEDVDAGRACDTRPLRPVASDAEVADADANVDVATNGCSKDRNMEKKQACHVGDDRPIRPTRVVHIQSAQIALAGANGSDDDAGALACVDEAMNTNSAQTNQSWDKHPIWPARTVPDETALGIVVGTANDTAAANDDGAVDEPSASDEVEKAVRSWDDRPIRPTPTAFIAPGDANNAGTNTRSTVTAGANTTSAASEMVEDAVTQDLDGGNVGSATTGDADEDPLVQTTSQNGHPTRPAQSMPNDDDPSANLFGVNVGGTKLVSTGESILPKHQQQATNDCPSALNECDVYSSGAGIPKTQDRQDLQPITPLYAFERRCADSETTSGSENGEIALLGGLEDVFDPVDELLPAMRESFEELDDVDWGSVSKTARQEVPISHDGNTTEERGGACDNSGGYRDVYHPVQKEDGVENTGQQPDGNTTEERGGRYDNSGGYHGVCHPAQEEADAGSTGQQPDGISFLEQFGTVKYCERKQCIFPVSDKLSLAMFNADQDDADLVFEVLVGDDPITDDWFHDVSSRDIHARSHSNSTPAVDTSELHGVGLRSTYSLIMGNASPEDILKADLSSEDEEEFDLITTQTWAFE